MDKKGSVIISDINSGKILSMVSSPSYDLGVYRGTTSEEDWDKLLSNSDKPLLNRSIAGLYPAGSMLKLITTIKHNNNHQNLYYTCIIYQFFIIFYCIIPLLNLISNAIKFGNKENNIIEIDVIEKRRFYQFSINDNGIGIDKKFHDRIFKVFHFLNKSDKFFKQEAYNFIKEDPKRF